MAVKPWIGAVKEPDNHPPVNSEQPETTYNLEYAYGYRCSDSRQNVYYNPQGNVAYMTAAIGVILDKASNTQKFFGGGECENLSKQVSSTQTSHNNDIMCMKVNQCGGRTHAVTGQVGKSPAVFVWDTCSAEIKCRVTLNKDSRAVSACAISKDAMYIACADEHNDHNVRIFEVAGGQMVSVDKGGPDKIFDMCFSNADGNYDVWTAGVKHLGYWNKENGYEKKNGIFGDKDRTSFSCITADD